MATTRMPLRTAHDAPCFEGAASDVFRYLAQVEELCHSRQRTTDAEIIRYAVYYTGEGSWDTWSAVRDTLDDPKVWQDFKTAIASLYPQNECAQVPAPLPASLPQVAGLAMNPPVPVVILTPAALQPLLRPASLMPPDAPALAQPSPPPAPVSPPLPLPFAVTLLPKPFALVAPPHLPPADTFLPPMFSPASLHQALLPTPVLPIPQPALITPASLPTASLPCAPPTAAVAVPALTLSLTALEVLSPAAPMTPAIPATLLSPASDARLLPPAPPDCQQLDELQLDEVGPLATPCPAGVPPPLVVPTSSPPAPLPLPAFRARPPFPAVTSSLPVLAIADSPPPGSPLLLPAESASPPLPVLPVPPPAPLLPPDQVLSQRPPAKPPESLPLPNDKALDLPREGPVAMPVATRAAIVPPAHDPRPAVPPAPDEPRCPLKARPLCLPQGTVPMSAPVHVIAVPLTQSLATPSSLQLSPAKSALLPTSVPQPRALPVSQVESPQAAKPAQAPPTVPLPAQSPPTAAQSQVPSAAQLLSRPPESSPPTSPALPLTPDDKVFDPPQGGPALAVPRVTTAPPLPPAEAPHSIPPEPAPRLSLPPAIPPLPPPVWLPSLPPPPVPDGQMPTLDGRSFDAPRGGLAPDPTVAHITNFPPVTLPSPPPARALLQRPPPAPDDHPDAVQQGRLSVATRWTTPMLEAAHVVAVLVGSPQVPAVALHPPTTADAFAAQPLAATPAYSLQNTTSPTPVVPPGASGSAASVIFKAISDIFYSLPQHRPCQHEDCDACCTYA